MRQLPMGIICSLALLSSYGAARQSQAKNVHEIANVIDRVRVAGGTSLTVPATGKDDISLQSLDVMGNVKGKYEVDKLGDEGLTEGTDNAMTQMHKVRKRLKLAQDSLLAPSLTPRASTSSESSIVPLRPTGTVHPYTVEPGDILFDIAKKFYNNGNQWPLIQDANPGVDLYHLKPGQKLQIRFGQYTVQMGDNLADIAKRYCGNEEMAEQIARANPEIKENPNSLQIGQQLRIAPPC